MFEAACSGREAARAAPQSFEELNQMIHATAQNDYLRIISHEVGLETLSESSAAAAILRFMSAISTKGSVERTGVVGPHEFGMCSPGPEPGPSNGRQKTIANRQIPSLASTGTARDEVFDVLPGFGIRISDTKDADPARRGKAGKITFILYARFASGRHPERRTIGVFGEDAMRLEDARRIAGESRGASTPPVVEAERRAAETRERALRIKHSFTIAPEAFIAAKLKTERSGKVPERDLRGVFIAAWGERPVSAAGLD